MSKKQGWTLSCDCRHCTEQKHISLGRYQGLTSTNSKEASTKGGEDE